MSAFLNHRQCLILRTASMIVYAVLRRNQQCGIRKGVLPAAVLWCFCFIRDEAGHMVM